MTITLLQVEQAVKHWVTFVKGHEKLVLILVSAALIFHFGEKGLNLWDAHDKAKGTAQQIIVKQDDADLKAALAISQAQNIQNVKTLAALEARIDAKLAQEKQQEQIDAKLPLPELATRWVSLIAAQPDAVTSNPNGTLTVTGDAAHATVSELEKVPQLTEQVLDTQAEVKSCTDTLAVTNKSLDQSTKTLADEKKSHQDDVNTLKVEKKKAWISGFKWGAVAGFVGGIFVMHKI